MALFIFQIDIEFEESHPKVYSALILLFICISGVVSLVAGNEKFAFADGIGEVSAFNHPHGIDVHPITSDIFVADSNHRIRKISAGMTLRYPAKLVTIIIAGVVSTVAGTGTSGSLDASVHNSTFSSPFDVKFYLKDESLLVADRGNNRIRKIHQGTLQWLLDEYPNL